MHENKCPYCLKEFGSKHQLCSHYAQKPCAKYRERYIRQLGEKAYRCKKAVPSRRIAAVHEPITVCWSDLKFELEVVNDKC
jgi:hypothetical protein